jgi:hypothetical protein
VKVLNLLAELALLVLEQSILLHKLINTRLLLFGAVLELAMNNVGRSF